MKRYVIGLIVFTLQTISAYTPEKPIVVIVPSYNNIDWYERNLSSVFEQNYTNWELHYCCDASSDGTGQAVTEYIRAQGQEHRCTVHINTERRGALYNVNKIVRQLPDHVICVNLDGDDWFAHPNALKIINEAYADPHVWMTYGQYIHYPSKRPGTCRAFPDHIVAQHAYRGYAPHSGILSHPRTYYAWLFKQIDVKDFLADDGTFFTAACDLAQMLPMIEMAHTHCKFIPDVLYEYNQANQINVFRTRVNVQGNNAQTLHYKRPKYQPLNRPPYLEREEA